jgi:high-affinity iron transporter
MHTRLTYRQIAIGFAMSLMTVGIQLSAPQAQPLSPLDQGKVVYMGNCSGCHGMEGGGDGPFAAGMTPAPTNFKTATVATLSDNTIQQAVLVGKGPVMRGYSTILTSADINALVLYLRSLETTP